MCQHLAILHKYLGLFGEQSESWKRPHQEVMEAYRKADGLSEAVAQGLFILERLNRYADGPMTVTLAEGLTSAYRDWYAAAGTFLEAVEESETNGFPVEGADKLRKAHETLGSRMEAVVNLQESIQDYRDGREKSLEDVFNGLQSDVQPQSDRTA